MSFFQSSGLVFDSPYLEQMFILICFHNENICTLSDKYGQIYIMTAQVVTHSLSGNRGRLTIFPLVWMGVLVGVSLCRLHTSMKDLRDDACHITNGK